MIKLKKTVIIIMGGILLLGLSGCSVNAKKAVPANNQNIITSAAKDRNIDLEKLNISLPQKWTKTGNADEISFDDENEQSAGGITVVGYYGEYKASLPNHSEVLNSEDIDTSIGKGKLFTLERDNPAASGNSKSWVEIHAVIPSNNNLAYDFWLLGKKDILLSILKSAYLKK